MSFAVALSAHRDPGLRSQFDRHLSGKTVAAWFLSLQTLHLPPTMEG